MKKSTLPAICVLALSIISTPSFSGGLEIQGIAIGKTLNEVKKIHKLNCRNEDHGKNFTLTASQSLCELANPIIIYQLSAPKVMLIFHGDTLQSIHAKLAWTPPRASEQFTLQQSHLRDIRMAIESEYAKSSVVPRKPRRCNYCKHDSGYEFILPQGRIVLSSGPIHNKEGFITISYLGKAYVRPS